MKRAPRNSRGQALAEVALCLAGFIVILIFGIHFGETTFLAMKVTEASAAPLWDSTAGKQHTIPTSFAEATASLAGAEGNAQSRYASFDGRSGHTGTSSSQVFAAASGMSVSCKMGGVWNFFAGGPPPFITDTYRDNGGATCTSTAQATSIRMLSLNYTFCAIGRAPCKGAMSMLTDDWGLAGPDESGECVVNPYGGGCTGNTPYSSAVRKVFEASWTPTFEHVNLVQGVVGQLPDKLAEVTAFYMSYRGEESNFTETVQAGDKGDADWQTTPDLVPLEYQASHQARNDAYLGK